MAAWSRHSQYAPSDPLDSGEEERPPPLPARPRSANFQQGVSSSTFQAEEYAPVLPPRPYSGPRGIEQEGVYAPVLPPRPYHAPSGSRSSLAPPPSYDVATSLPRMRNVSPRPYYGDDWSTSPPQPLHPEAEIVQPQILSPTPTRPAPLPPSQPRPEPTDSTMTLTPTASSSSSDVLDTSDVKLLEAGIASIPSPQHSLTSYPKLSKPIAIPQLSVRSRLLHVMPFTRAHPPILTSTYDISAQDFMKVVDTINICVAAHPIFQGVHVAAAGVGMVPEPVFIAVGLALDGVGSAGTRITKYFRLKGFLEKMNEQVFHPRGLHIQIVKDPDLVRDMLDLDESEVLREMGEVPSSNSTSNSNSEYDGSASKPLSQKRYEVLARKGKIENLDFENIPPSENVSNILDKISAKNQKRKTERKKRKILKRQLKHEERSARKTDKKEGDDVKSMSSDGWSESASTLGPETTSTSRSHGSSSVFTQRSEKVKSNAMEYDDSSTASSDSDSDSGVDKVPTAVQKARSKADAKASKVLAKADEKLASNPSDKKTIRIEEEREKELNAIEREWAKVHEKAEVKDAKKEMKKEEKREKRLEKRVKGNRKRMEKAGKRMQRLEWIVITNLEEQSIV